MPTTMELGTSYNLGWTKMNPSEVEYAWHKLLPFIERAIEQAPDEMTPEDVRERLRNQFYYAWAIHDGPKLHAVLVTEVAQYQYYRVCRVVLLSGEDFEHWRHLEGILEMWARDAGCKYIEAFTRPGLAKKLYPDGYRHTHCLIRKQITRGAH